MQVWSDRLDPFEKNRVDMARMHLTITRQGLSTIVGQADTHPPIMNPNMPSIIVAPTISGIPEEPESVQRLSAVPLPGPQPSVLHRERMKMLDQYKAPNNLRLDDLRKS